MDIRIVCQSCGAEYKIPEDRYRGKASKFSCKQCSQEIFLIPSAEGVQITGGALVEEITSEADVTKRLGKFRALERIASGGMGTIYKAKLPGAEGFEKQVALKVLHPHMVRDRAFAKAMVDEAKITVQLNHPNIVQMFNLERSGELLYCVMEFVPGESLATIQRTYRRKGGSVGLDMAIYIAAEALEGLAYAHELRDPDGNPLGIVHRDVSPHNIMVTDDGWVKLIDFGIAKAVDRSTQTRPGTIKGKFAYMAPEQLKGETDHRADVFAMGVVLWEVLAGVRLFYSSTDVDTLQKVLHLEPPPISMNRPEIPKGLDAILSKALAKVPQQRFQTAREFKAALLEFVKPRSIADLRPAVDIRASRLAEPAEGEVAGFEDVTPALDAKDMFEADTRFESMTPSGSREVPTPGKRIGLRIGLILLALVGLGVGTWIAWPHIAGDRTIDAGTRPAADAGVVAGDAGSGQPGADADVVTPADARAADAGAQDAGVDAGKQVAVKRPPRHPKPVKLTKRTIQRRLERSGARLQACADQHLLKAGLGNHVELVLEFTIAQAGKVARAKLTPAKLEATRFGRCLLGRVKAIHFPRHVDKSVTVSFPLKFQAVGN